MDVTAFLFFGFKVCQSTLDIHLTSKNGEVIDINDFDNIIEDKLYSMKLIKSRPDENSISFLKEIGDFLHFIERHTFGCSLVEAGYLDAGDEVYYLIIKESQKAATSEFGAAKDVLFNSLPISENWQDRLDKFCDRFDFKRQKASWILTLQR